MSNYTEIGFDSFLLRPLEASFVEQIGIDSSSAFEQISGLQVKGDKITSLNQNLTLDLENGNIRISNGNVDLFTFGKLEDGTLALLIKDAENKEIGRIDENGLTILNGKISIFNNDNNIILSQYGLTLNNFRKNSIIKKADQSIIGDDSYQLINDFSFDIELKIETIVYLFANIQFDCASGLFDTGDVAFVFSIDGQLVPVAPAGNSGWNFDPGYSTASLSHIIKLSAGHHNFQVFAARRTPDITFTILGINGGSNCGYLLLGGI